MALRRSPSRLFRSSKGKQAWHRRAYKRRNRYANRLCIESLEDRRLLAVTQILSTTGTNKIVLPDFNEGMGTLQRADVSVNVGAASTGSSVIPNADHTHLAVFDAVGGGATGGFRFNLATLSSGLGSHSHSIPQQDFMVQTLWNQTSVDRTAPATFAGTTAPSIEGQTHAHNAPNLTFETLGGSYNVLTPVGSPPQLILITYAVGTGTATNGVFVPKNPFPTGQVVNGTLIVRVRAATLPAASAGNFSHTHSVTTTSGPFTSSGATLSVNPTGNSSHSHSLSVNVTPRSFTSSGDLATYFANGSNVNLTATLGTAFSHTHTIPNLLTTTTTIFTYDARPVAIAGGIYSGNEGDSIRFDGSGSSDDVGIGLFEWDFDYDGLNFTQDATGPVVNRRFDNEVSTRNIALRVTDTLGQKVVSTSTLTVHDVAPIVNPLGQQSTQPNLPALFDLGSFSDPGNDGPYNVLVNWGDGSAASVFQVSQPGAIGTQLHAFAEAGLYNVSVSVSDRNNAGTGSAQNLIAVNNFPTATLTVLNPAVSEGIGSFAAVVELDSPAVTGVTIEFLHSGTASYLDDYTVSSNVVFIPPGSSSYTVTITVIDDQIYEATEQLVLALGVLGNARPALNTPQIVQILDNEPVPTVSFTESTQNAEEGSAPVSLTARLSAVSGNDVTIPLSFAGSATQDVDYFLNSGAVILIPAGQFTGTATVGILDDTLGEGNELVVVSMQTPSGAVLSSVSGQVTQHTIRIPISDTPTVQFISANQRILEANENFDIVVALSSPSDLPVTVNLIKPTTSTAPSTIPLTFLPGQTNLTRSFSVVDNSLNQPDQNLSFSLSSPTNAILGGAREHLVRVEDDDISIVTMATPSQVQFEDAGQIRFTVNLSQAAPTSVIVPVRLSGSAPFGADYSFASTTVIIPAGHTSADGFITLVDDTSRENQEQLFVTLDYPLSNDARLGEQRSHVVTLMDDDPEAGFDVASRGCDEDAGTIRVRVTLTAPTNRDVAIPVEVYAGTARTEYRGGNPPDVSAPRQFTVIIPAGATYGESSALTIVDDTIHEFNESFTLRIGTPSNALVPSLDSRIFRQQTITIYGNDAPLPVASFATSDLTVQENQGGLSIVASLSSVTTSDVIIPLQYSGTAAFGLDYVGTSGIVIPSGSRQGSATIFIIDDVFRNEGDETIKVSMHDVIGATLAKPQPLTITIRDNDRSASVPIQNAIKPTSTTAHQSSPTAVAQSGTLAVSAVLGNAADVSGSSSDTGVVADPAYTAPDSTQPFTVQLILPGGAFAGSTVFFDGNFNGVLDPEEPSAVSEYDATVVLTIPETFDLNDNATLDLNEGRLVVVGGIDIATGLPLQLRLTAPAGYFAASMMSTVISSLVHEHGLSLADAQNRLLQALDLPSVDLFALDVVDRAAAGDANAAEVFAGLARLEDTVDSIANLVSGINGAPPIAIVGDLTFADIAAKIEDADSILDMSRPEIAASLIRGTLFAAGLDLDPQIVTGAAQIIAESNALVDAIPLAADASFLTEVARIQKMLQGEVADQLRQVAAGEISIGSVVQAFTGISLDAQIAAVTPGNVVAPLLYIDDVVQREGDAGSVVLEFKVFLQNPPAAPVSVDWMTSDDTSTLSDGDYQQNSGRLNWAAGETSPRTISITVNSDVVLEGDESFRVLLSNPINAAVRRSAGYGFVLNDDALHHTTPGDTGENTVTLVLGQEDLSLLQNDALETQAAFLNPLDVLVTGRDDIDDILTLDFSASTYRSDTIRYDGGGGTGLDTVIVSGGNFDLIRQSLTNSTDGQTVFDPFASDAEVTLNWIGLEPFLIDVGSVGHLIFELPAGVTTAILEDADATDTTQPGMMQLRSPDGHFETTTFTNPTTLTIRGGNGADTITIGDLDPSFAGTILITTTALGTDPIMINRTAWTAAGAETIAGTIYDVFTKGIAPDIVSLKIPFNTAPVANAGGPYTGFEGTSLMLDASQSHDAEDSNTLLQFEWDLNYDGITFDVDATGEQPVVSFPDNFTARNVALRVTDPSGESDFALSSVVVDNLAPVISGISVTSTIDEGGFATLTGDLSDPGTVDTFTLEINWGDPLSPHNTETVDLTHPPVHATFDATTRRFTVRHQYLDDNPTGTPHDSYSIRVGVADDDSMMTLFESASLGGNGSPRRFGMDRTQFLGVRFQVDATSTITRIGLNQMNGFGQLFGAIVRLSGPTDSPDSSDLSTDDLVGSAVIPVGTAQGEYGANLNAVLEPGWYALLFGSGLFDAAGYGEAPGNDTDLGSPLYLIRDGAGHYLNGPNGVRYFIEGLGDTLASGSSAVVTVENVAPTIVADLASVVTGEGAGATNTGTFSDPGFNDTVTLSASVGQVMNNGNGTWSWSMAITDGPRESQTVWISATDDDGGATTTTFDLLVNNVAPHATLSAPTNAITYQQLDFVITAGDPSPWDQSEGFTYVIDFSDGTSTQVARTPGNATGVTVRHLYSVFGSYTVTATATDTDGGTSAVAVHTVNVVEIAPAALQEIIDEMVGGGNMTPTVELATTSDAELDAVLAAVKDLSIKQENPRTKVVVDLGDNSYAGIELAVPDGVTATIQNGTLTGASPALTVHSGVVIAEAMTLTNSTAASTVLVIGGSLAMRESTLIETDGGDYAAIEITGGTVDLGTTVEAGGNTLLVRGAGQAIRNLSTNAVSALGNTFQAEGSTLTSGFRIEDVTYHALDAAGIGLVTWEPGHVYVTHDSHSVQRGVDAVSTAGTVNVEAGFDDEYDAGAQLLTVAYQDGPTLIAQVNPFDATQREIIVIGTDGRDKVDIEEGDVSGAIEIKIKEKHHGEFKVKNEHGPTINRIIVYGLGGDDDIKVNKSVGAIPAELYGGDGDDKLRGGEGDDYLSGGDGDDVLSGRGGRDVMIGGAGKDKIDGDGGDDILIGAVYLQSEDRTATHAIMSEWSRTDLDYAARIDHLFSGGGLNGGFLLNPTTVFDDNAKDKLRGGKGLDWFLGDDDDDKTDEKLDELLTLLELDFVSND